MEFKLKPSLTKEFQNIEKYNPQIIDLTKNTEETIYMPLLTDELYATLRVNFLNINLKEDKKKLKTNSKKI